MNVTPPTQRTLTVFCPLGLSNRLRVLLSGLALAEASGRQFTMLWPLTPACAAPFADLFANEWPVRTVAADAIAGLPYISGWFGHLSDLLAAPEENLVLGYPGWLIRPEQFPDHAALMAPCRALFTQLQPISSIQQEIDTFRQYHFRPTMIGVHLRRGDLLRQRPDTANNTVQALNAVDRFLDASPDAGILLCTDDGAPEPASGRSTPPEGLREKFGRRYGPRLVSPTPRSLDRNASLAVQDALIDLYLLRACNYFVGTMGSSFSDMVVFGQETPHALTAGATPAYARLERIARWTGLYALLSHLGQRQIGRPLPFPALFLHYSRSPLRWLRKIQRNLTPIL